MFDAPLFSCFGVSYKKYSLNPYIALYMKVKLIKQYLQNSNKKYKSITLFAKNYCLMFWGVTLDKKAF